MLQYAIKGRLIDGISNQTVEKGLVVTEGERIVYAGDERGYSLSPDTSVLQLEGGTILPGLIDCHTHVTGSADLIGRSRGHFDCLLTAARDLGTLLDAGFTYIRDMTVFSGALKRAVANGTVRGPGIVSGGRVLSPTAGHVDHWPHFPAELVAGFDATGFLADGVEGCLKATRAQFRDGAEFIKICATGGVSSSVDGLDDVQFSDEEIAVIAAEAARHGTYVAAHCSNASGTLQALKNGVTCIEHGIELNEACLEIMAKKDIPVTTTLFVSNLVATSHDFPAYMVEKGKKAAEKHIRSMRMAKDAGICIALGTDFSNSVNTPFRRNGMELRAIVRAGFTPMEAIQIGTAHGAKVLRLEDRIGSLEAGKQADLIVLDGNPLEDIELLTDAEHVRLVMQKGNIVKDIRNSAEKRLDKNV